MLGALLYLRATSLANLVRSRARRLREPKYFFGAIATVAYFYYFFFRRFAAGPGGGGVRSFNPLQLGSSIFVLAILAGWVAFAWIFPSAKGGLRFSPAEISFLFPAPLSRRALVHFSLAGSQLKLLFTAALLGLVWGRAGFSWRGTLLHVAGWWIVLVAAELHRTAANLIFAQRRERGLDAVRGRAVAVAAVVLYAVAVGIAIDREAPPWPAPAGSASLPLWSSYLVTLVNTGTLRWLLLPFHLVAGPFLATGGRAFLAALAPALAILVLHYRWILRQEVSFAEGSITLAEKRAEARAVRQAGGSVFGTVPTRARREPFRLSPLGRPEGAFLWKNLLSVSGTVNWRFLLIALQVVVMIVILSSIRAQHGGPHAVALTVVSAAALLGVYALMYGPQLLRLDLRGDLANLDLLKTYPLAGWQVVLAEMLAPIALLSAVLWACLAALSWGLATAEVITLPAAVRLTATFCAASLVPPLCALELLVPNATLLLFPAWYQATRSRGGIDTIGQRLIFMFGQLLTILVLLLPALACVPVLVFATAWLIGPAAAVVLATIAAHVIVGFELLCGVWWLGERFERLDLSAELRP